MKKCNACRKNLLALERPDRPAESTAAHLAECAACRNWQRRLLLAERAVARLAVPPAEEARTALIRRLLEQPAPAAAKSAPTPAPEKTPRRSVAMVLGSWIMDPHASPRRRVGAGMVAGIAAILLLSFGGWLFWYMGRGSSAPQVVTKPDPFLAQLRDKKLSNVPSDHANPQERVRGMISVADSIVRRSDAEAHSSDKVAALAELYEQVVNNEIVPQSGLLSPKERDDLITQFEKAESLASRLAADQDVSHSARESFKKIAIASRDAHSKLRDQSAVIPT
jgi:hypothetical protein